MPGDQHPHRPDADRRLRQATRFARILRVLEMIQGRACYGVKDMAAELEVSERTIFRDLNVLELAGVPWFHDEDERRYRVRPGYNFPALNLDEEELIGQATAGVIAATPGLDVTRGAAPTTRKLWVTSRDEAAKLLDDVERVTTVLDLKLADHGRDHETIRKIQWTLCRGKKLSATYRSPYEEKPKRLDLHPYRLCLVRQAWYLVARADDADQPRTYRVTRFQSLRALDAASQVPVDFDLRAYFGNAWGVYRGNESFDVTVRFGRDAADLVTETTWHATQQAERHADGGVTLRFVVDGLNEVVHWVLGWSGRARVIGPESLRLLVLEHLKRATELNQPG